MPGELGGVFGDLPQDVELPLEFLDPGVALVLLELGGRDRRLQRFVQRPGGLVGDAAVVVAQLTLDEPEPVARFLADHEGDVVDEPAHVHLRVVADPQHPVLHLLLVGLATHQQAGADARAD